VTSGRVRVGEELEWLPRGERVRVRSLQNHGQTVDEVHRGQRAAINLAGVPHQDVVRGQELATPGYLVPARVLTVRLHCLPGARAIKHRLPVRFHLGTAEVLGVVALLDCDKVEPGAWRPAQVFLEEPVTVVWGQPFVLRESSAMLTLGGGQVLQPVARKIRRRHKEILEQVGRLGAEDVGQRALAAAWLSGFAGVTPAALVRQTGVGPAEAGELLRHLLDRGEMVEVQAGQARPGLFLHAGVVRNLEDRILEGLAQLHQQFPLLTMHEGAKVHGQLAYLGKEMLIDFALERLLRQGRLVGDLRRLARRDFKPRLTTNQLKLKEKVLAAYQEAGLKPLKPSSFAGQAGGNAGNLDDLFALCVAEGQLVHIAEDFYLSSAAEGQLRRLVGEALARRPGLTVAEIRDVLGTGRKHAILMCEYLDRIGVTRRKDDLRWLAESDVRTGHRRSLSPPD
jgi:selenocysteine-specific elongation factor